MFANARMMYVASLGAFLVGSLLDIADCCGVMKRWTGGRMIWLRATGSTVVGQVFDSLIVSYLAFGLGRQLIPSGSPPAPLPDILKIAATGYTLKFALAVGITPDLRGARGAAERAGDDAPPRAESVGAAGGRPTVGAREFGLRSSGIPR